MSQKPLLTMLHSLVYDRIVMMQGLTCALCRLQPCSESGMHQSCSCLQSSLSTAARKEPNVRAAAAAHTSSPACLNASTSEGRGTLDLAGSQACSCAHAIRVAQAVETTKDVLLLWLTQDWAQQGAQVHDCTVLLKHSEKKGGLHGRTTSWLMLPSPRMGTCRPKVFWMRSYRGCLPGQMSFSLRCLALSFHFWPAQLAELQMTFAWKDQWLLL